MTFSTSHARPDPSDSVISSCGHLTYCIHQLEATLQFVSDFPQNHDNHLRKAVSGEIEITSATATPTARRRQPGETMAVAAAHTPPPKPLRQTFLLQMSAFYILHTSRLEKTKNGRTMSEGHSEHSASRPRSPTHAPSEGLTAATAPTRLPSCQSLLAASAAFLPLGRQLPSPTQRKVSRSSSSSSPLWSSSLVEAAGNGNGRGRSLFPQA